MAEEDELYYLQPGFDLNSLTIPKLRGILVANGIPFPSSAKKGDLVDILDTQLLPQAKKLLRARDRVRRTSKGITDVPSSQEGTVDDDEDNDRGLMPPPPAPKTPRGRKSRTNLAGEDDVATPRTASRRSKTPSTRKSAVKASRTSDVETTTTTTTTDTDILLPPPSTTKRTRKSTPGPVAVPQPPSVRLQDARDTRSSLESGDSPFTQDNPFQSGSSPLAAEEESRRLSGTTRSRKSISGTSTRKPSSRRRDTRSPSSPSHIKSESDSPSSRATYEFPVSHISTGRDGIETTEEFTQDAKMELAHDLGSNRQLAKSRSSAITRHKKQKPVSTAAKATSLAILTTILAAAAAWYRQEKVAVGYCGVGNQDTWSLVQYDNVPDWLHENLAPQCEACPPHAICGPDMSVQCDNDFVLRQHPLSFNGLIPLPPTCEPDSEKERRVRAVADRAVEELRQRKADYECGTESSITGLALSDTSESSHTQSSSAVVSSSSTKLEISESALKATLSKQRRKNMTPQEFEDLWQSALGDIKSRDEIEVTEDGLLSSTSLARVPLGCALRLSTFRLLRQNRLALCLVTVLLVLAAYLRQRIVQYQTASAQTPSLVAMTLDRLATQAALLADGRVDEAFLSVSQLRDDVLRNVFSKSERERVWERVKAIVEKNANVRASTREGKRTGEWGRVWEWIGPVSIGLEGRKSGGMIEASPASNNADETANGSAVKDRELRRWDEGRAIY